MQEKILVIQTAFLGDAILTLPMIQKLKDKYPLSEIDVLCIPNTKLLFEHSKAVNNVVVYDKRESQKSFFSFLKLINLIGRNNYSSIYSPHKSFRTSLIVLFSGAKLTVGFNSASLSFIYKSRVKYINSKHEVARNLDLIGYNTDNDRWKIIPGIDLSLSVENNIQTILNQLTDKKIIAIAPGSVWKTKVYPQEYFIEIIKYLITKDFFIVLIGGKEDELICNEIENKISDSIKSFAGRMNILESISIIKHSSILISNDSAPTHLGMIADIPVLTIYCSTVPSFGFTPYNEKSKYISYDELTCKPCGIHGHNKCPIKTFDCAYKLFPRSVISTIERMI